MKKVDYTATTEYLPALLLVAGLVLGASAGYAGGYLTAQQDQSDVRNALAELETELEQAQSQITELTADLRKANDEIERLRKLVNDTPTPKPPTPPITLTSQDTETPWAFEINDESNPTIRLKQGETIEIRFVNDGNTVHDFTIEELDITDETTFLEPGEEVTITIKSEKTGTFTYFCSQPGHKDLGMFGELIIE